MNVIARAKAPTPPFFKKLRNIGLLLGAVSAAVFAAPVALPGLLASIIGYLGVAGGVITTVSQLAIPVDPPKPKPKRK